MQETEKKFFVEMLTGACEMINGHAPSITQVKIWWSLFCDYEIHDVRLAFEKAVDDAQGRLVPAKVKKYLPSKFNHPEAEEAWNHLLIVISDCGYLSDEMRAAWGACSALLDMNDRVGARMAFLEKYRASVNQAKNQPNFTWLPSGGLSFEQEQETKLQRMLELCQKSWIQEHEALKRINITLEKLGRESFKSLNQKNNLSALNLIENTSKKTMIV